MVMAVDHSAAQLSTDLVELVTESGHLVGAVLITGDDLVNRVDNYRQKTAFQGAADQLWCQLVHGHALASQVPDLDVIRVPRLQPQSGVHVGETMDAAGPIQLKVHIQHLALSTGKSHPVGALGNADAQLDQAE